MSKIRRSMMAVLAAGVLSVAGLVSAGGAGAQTETVEGSFDMLSYNVAGLPEALSDSNPSVNMALIGPLLDAYDLVLTQEDFANPDPPLENIRVYHDVLLATTNFPHVSEAQLPPLGSDPEHPDALLGDGLSFFSQFALGSLQRVTWDDCMGVATHSSDCLAIKGFAMTTIELAPGVTVDVYDLHADAGSAIEDQQARASNFSQLAAYITEHSAGHAVIVGGDTNLKTARPDRREDARVWQDFLAATGLADVCETVDCGEDSDVIDKIAFRSGGDIDVTPETHSFERERFTRDDGEPLSDHDPLHVRFSYVAQVTAPTTTTLAQAPPTTVGAAPSAPAVTRSPDYTG